MPTTTQFVITQPSEPGTLAQLASVFGQAGLNIMAFCAAEVPSGTEGAVRFVLNDPERARTALTAGGIPFREETALVVSLKHRPGALSEVVEHLRAAGIMITCGYYTPSREGGKAIVVLTVSDTTKAMDVLKGESLDVL